MTQASALSSPGTSIVAITPSDSTDLVGCRGVFTTDAGDLVVKTIHGASNGTEVTITDMPIGLILPLQITRVMAATTATQVYGLF